MQIYLHKILLTCISFTNLTIKDYGIHIYWDTRASYFVAEIQEIPACAADGATRSEALSNLEETFAVLKEAYVEENMPLPRPNPGLPISIGEISVLSDVIKASRLAELSGIPVQTLATKMNRRTELSSAESKRIMRALNESGLALGPRLKAIGKAGLGRDLKVGRRKVQ